MIPANTRIYRGFVIVEEGLIEEELMDEDMFQFTVFNEKGDSYLVSMINDFWRCDCPDYQYRSGELREEGASFLCKHIYAVILRLGRLFHLKVMEQTLLKEVDINDKKRI